MGINVKAVQRKQVVGKYAGTYRYQMSVETYNSLAASKVIEEAAVRSGLSQGILEAAWHAMASVVKAWATEGHRVAIPGLGSMRFGVNATTVEEVENVDKELITCRKVIFMPNSAIRRELEATSINITCYDKDGNVVKRVTSDDDGNVEDPETNDPVDPSDPENNGGNSGGGGYNPDDDDDEGGLEG